MSKQKSRKTIPWEGKEKMTPIQTFLKEKYDTFYAERHQTIADSSEAEMINSYVLVKCRSAKEKNSRKADIQEAEYNTISVQNAAKHFRRQQEQYLTSIKSQSANGQNIARIYFAMSSYTLSQKDFPSGGKCS